MRKLKTVVFSSFCIFAFVSAKSQYKDLDGVFFGKVIAIGAGAGIQSFSSGGLGTNVSVAPLLYDVMLNNKTIISWKFAIHKKRSITYSGNTMGIPYTQRGDFRFFEMEFGWATSLSPQGLDAPTSIFLGLSGGALVGRPKITDSDWGESDNYGGSGSFIGAGLRLNQRIGSRLLLIAYPSYRFSLQGKSSVTYLGRDGEQKITLSHLNGQIGLLYIIGRNN